MDKIFKFIQDGGIIMYPLLILALAAFSVIFERFSAYRTLGHTSPALLKKVLGLVQEAKYEDAIQLCDGTPGPLAACLQTILLHRDRPVAVAERQVEEVGQEYFIRLESGLPFLDTTTTISPLLGLLGTLVGMIGTFNAIAGQQGRGGNSDSVLAGVGEALYATATGITIAIICFIAYNAFNARIRAITSSTEQASTRLINVLVDMRAGHFPAEDARVEEAKARAI